jgi:hypothetical protein
MSVGSYSDPALILPGAVGTTELADGAVANVKVDPASAISFFVYGSYTGNNTANRAIAHGLPHAPRFIYIVVEDSTWHAWQLQAGRLVTQDGGYSSYDLTAPDSTNFYVGNSASYPVSGNGSGITYHWVAIG